MKKLLFVTFILLALENSMADSWVKSDGWGSPSSMEETNKGIRDRASKDGKEAAEFKRKWDADTPQREARQRVKEAAELETKKRKDAAWNALPDDKKQRIVDEIFKVLISSNLKDPGSAQYRSSAFEREKGVYCGWVNAKNGYGGYTGYQLMCTNDYLK